MEKYTLFLDERDDSTSGHILVSGFTIPNNQLDLFEQKISEVKEIIWDKAYIESNETVLHCTELSTIYNNRHNKYLYKYIKRDAYKTFLKMDPSKIKNVYNDVYIKLCEIMKSFDITVFGCLLDKNKLHYLFDTNSRKLLEDYYNIALQSIIENYTHFLNVKNGVGYIVYESRNSSTDVARNSQDMTMYDNFCKIKADAKGLTYTNINSIANRIRYLNIVRKTEENAGLEYADFITYNLFRSFFINDNRDKSEFIKKIEKRLYNGGFVDEDKDLRNFFGIRYVPEDFEKYISMKKELDKLKNAHNKLKIERNNLIKKNDLLKQEKEELKNKLLEEKQHIVDKMSKE